MEFYPKNNQGKMTYKISIKKICRTIVERIIKSNKLAEIFYKDYIKFKKKWQEYKYWQARIKNVLLCPDNKYIPRMLTAGKIKDNRLIMHNGLTVVKLALKQLRLQCEIFTDSTPGKI